jgi:hypothetical protein
MIFFNAKINQKYISNEIDKQLDTVFIDEETEINKIAFKFKRSNESSIDIGDKHIELKVPLSMKLSKKDGLFTADARGSIMITLSVQYDINKDLHAHTKTSIKEYIWLEKPILEIGVFDVSVEKLTDMALKYYDAIITGTIDAKLKPILNLESMIDDRLKQGVKVANANLPMGLKLSADLKIVMIEKPYTKDGALLVNGGVSPQLMLSDFENSIKISKQFRWVEKMDQSSVDYVELELSYVALEKLIKGYISNQEFGGKKISVNGVNLTYDGQNLILIIKVQSPIDATVIIIGMPKYNEHEGNLYLKNMDVNIKASSLIYKLTAPLLASYFENQLEDIFPLEISKLLGQKLLDSIPKSFGNELRNGKLGIRNIYLSTFNAIQDRLVGTLHLEDVILDIDVNA